MPEREYCINSRRLIFTTMEEKDIEYLDNFEARLTEDMLRLCTSLGMLDGTLLESEDITSKWKELAPEYMADAVPNIKEFPEAAVGWAGYIGLAVAKWWDEDWGKHHNAKYSSLLGPRGFDDMDEHIMENILGYRRGSAEAGIVAKTLLCCSQLAINSIRHENIETQSVLAFQAFARATRAMFRIGAAMELKREGYRFQKVRIAESGTGNRFKS